MKKILFAIFGTLVLTACSGDRGPVGPPGPQGPYVVGTVFEIANVNFNPANEFSFLGNFYDYIPSNIEIFQSDVVLIYLNEGVASGNDIWSPLPQTFYFPSGGTVQYNFNHTDVDFEIYLQGNVDLFTLPPSFTQNQIFRIAILPAEFAMDPSIDITNYDSVISALQASDPEFEIVRLEK